MAGYKLVIDQNKLNQHLKSIDGQIVDAVHDTNARWQFSELIKKDENHQFWSFIKVNEKEVA